MYYLDKTRIVTKNILLQAKNFKQLQNLILTNVKALKKKFNLVTTTHSSWKAYLYRNNNVIKLNSHFLEMKISKN